MLMTARTQRQLRARLIRTVILLLLHGAWLLCALPVVTWLSASVAMVHSLNRWIMHGDDRIFHNFGRGWCRHWRRTLPAGATSALVFVLLIANLMFLVTRDSAAALVLLMGTVAMLVMWAILNLALVPVIVLFPDLSTRRWLRESFVMAFRRPLSMIGVVFGCLVGSVVLLQIFAPLVVLGVGGTAYLGLKLFYRNLSSHQREGSTPRERNIGPGRELRPVNGGEIRA